MKNPFKKTDANEEAIEALASILESIQFGRVTISGDKGGLALVGVVGAKDGTKIDLNFSLTIQRP